MIYVNNLQESLKLFEALASPVRLKILDLLHDGSEMNINELAKKLELTNSALTMHIQKLSDCGLVRIRLSSFSRGMQKLCSLTEDKMLIELVDKMSNENYYETELDVGQYSEYSINPTCGLADTNALIGDLDNPQAFSFPERFHAHVVWYTDGYLTYRFPNKLLAYQKPRELQISFEISSESPGADPTDRERNPRRNVCMPGRILRPQGQIHARLVVREFRSVRQNENPFHQRRRNLSRRAVSQPDHDQRLAA